MILRDGYLTLKNLEKKKKYEQKSFSMWKKENE